MKKKLYLFIYIILILIDLTLSSLRYTYTISYNFFSPANYILHGTIILYTIFLIILFLSKKLAKYMCIVLVLFLIILRFSIIYDLAKKNCEGYFTIEKKEAIDKNFYFYVMNSKMKKIECSKELYNKLEVDELLLYQMKFEYNSYFPDKAFLLNINLESTIDNR